MLLDTHIFLWWLFDDPHLPDGLKEKLSDPEQLAFVSSASVWEISTKYSIGKLPQATSVANNVPLWIAKAGFQPLAITPEHAQLAGSWDNPHRDPFDRMLAAQSKLEKIPLASVDRALDSFPINLLRH